MSMSPTPLLARSAAQVVQGAVRVLRRMDEPATRPVSRPRGYEPAAVRVERSRGRSDNGDVTQTAMTLWFGDGPSLPSVNEPRGLGGGVRVGATVLGLACLAALASAVVQRELRATPQPRVIDAPK